MEEDNDMPHKKTSRKINLPLFGLAMFLLGAAALTAIHFATYQNDGVHHHANFAMYINGQKEEFKSFTFYEEVQACSANNADNVRARVHMHDNNPALVHVHAHGVTWGQFFTNLGYTLGDSVVATDAGVYADGQDGKQLTFLLNGKPVQAIENQLIKSEDLLLINYGNDTDQILQSRNSAIPRDAAKANTEHDPAACSGNHDATLMERMKQSMGFPAGNN